MKKTIRDYDLSGKKVIIRVDFNVPIKDGKIIDDNRIVQSLTTIKYAIDGGAKVILMSHLGRIKEEADKEKNSLRLVAERLSSLLGTNVIFVPETRGSNLEDAVNNLKTGDVLLMENTRFEDVPGKKESGNDLELAKYWASLGDLFVNDAFGTMHRSHASNVGIASLLPSAIGFLVKKEVDEISSALNNPRRPLVVMLGGAKVSDKIGVIENALKIADYVLIGGAMPYTFYKALGYNVGGSLVDDASIDFCKRVYEENKSKIILPTDVVVASSMTNEANTRLTSVNMINNNEIGVDVGVATLSEYKRILSSANTIIWNGPFGVFEIPKFSNGTRKIVEMLSLSKAKMIIGGGDSIAALNQFGFNNKNAHVSTGGGASLEMLEGKELPGLSVISDV